MSSTIMEATANVEPVEIGLNEASRRQLAGQMSAVLADTMLLMIKTQVYHWNVVGPLFKPIHDLTEEQYNDLFAASDEIAERIRALGFPVPVSFTDLVPKANLLEESDMRSAEGMVAQLARDHEALARNMRSAAEIAEDLNDYVTHDLLVTRMAFHEKTVWMLRAIIAN